MPSTLQALAVLAYAVLPGFLFLRGFDADRPRKVADAGLDPLARMLSVSTVILAVTWLSGGHDLLRNFQRYGDSDQNLRAAFWGSVILFGASTAAGFALGKAFAWLQGKVHESNLKQSRNVTLSTGERMVGALAHFGTFKLPSAWDRMWLSHARLGSWLIVKVRLKSGDEVIGAAGNRGFVDLSPMSHELVLDVEVQVTDQGLRPVPGSRGIFIDGCQIETLHFLDPSELGEKITLDNSALSP